MIVGDQRIDERLGAELPDQRDDRRDRAPFRGRQLMRCRSMLSVLGG
jgi:hypothetical protein